MSGPRNLLHEHLQAERDAYDAMKRLETELDTARETWRAAREALGTHHTGIGVGDRVLTEEGREAIVTEVSGREQVRGQLYTDFMGNLINAQGKQGKRRTFLGSADTVRRLDTPY